jgi:hypothetical protein
MSRDELLDECHVGIGHEAAAILENDIHSPQLSTGSIGTQDQRGIFF